MKSKRPVLLIEDDEAVRGSIQTLLESEGYPVVAAENGQDGLEKLAGMAESPCLVLLDLFMPVMDGSQFIEELKKDSSHVLASLPIALVSAAPENDLVRSTRSRTDAYIRKPIDLEHFLATVQQFCCGSNGVG